MFPGNSDSIDGNPMIVNLPEECLEGNAEFHNGDWKARCTPKVERHKQYLRGWTFCIEAVRRNLVKVPKAEWVVLAMVMVMKVLQKTKKMKSKARSLFYFSGGGGRVH